MEDVEITDVTDADLPEQVKKASLRNQDLSSLSLTVGELLSQYGWYLLVLTVLVYLLIQHLSKRRSSQSNRSSPSQIPQDATRKQEAMEAARRKMQEELNAKAAIFREKQKQQEEEKRRQRIETLESVQQGRSYKLSQQTTEEASSSTTVLRSKTDKRPLRSADYNPLTGAGGGSCSWRPGRRGPSSGG